VAKYYDKTDMGGAREVFLTTHWSLIEDIQSKHDKDQALMNLLLKRYWKPVYSYLRQKGYDNDQAKDLTQGFFYEVVLNRNLVQRADQCKGRFRSFLLHALNQYLINIQIAQQTKKQIPKNKLIPFENIHPLDMQQAISNLSPENAYNYAWLSALLDQILLEVEAGCCRDGMETHWNVFNDRVVKAILENVNPPSLVEICKRYGIEDEKKASNMNITVKRRFQTALKEYVRNTVTSDNYVAEELEEIMRFFPKSAQHFK
jgi:DNA-directed RNA polymerase specialized sigma24 family protein